MAGQLVTIRLGAGVIICIQCVAITRVGAVALVAQLVNVAKTKFFQKWTKKIGTALRKAILQIDLSDAKGRTISSVLGHFIP